MIFTPNLDSPKSVVLNANTVTAAKLLTQSSNALFIPRKLIVNSVCKDITSDQVPKFVRECQKLINVLSTKIKPPQTVLNAKMTISPLEQHVKSGLSL